MCLSAMLDVSTYHRPIMVWIMLQCPTLVLLIFGSTGSLASEVPEDVANKTSFPGVPVANVTYETSTNECPKSRSCESCGGAVAGAVVASLIVGLVVGAAMMYYAPRYWKRRKTNIPPKDYTSTQSSALDVNMNNGERTEEEVEDTSPTSAAPQVKAHKKLERLSNHGPKPIIGPKPVLGSKGKPNTRSSVETPLIFSGSKPDKIVSTNSRSEIIIPAQEQQQNRNDPSEHDHCSDSGDDGEQDNIYQDVDYTNIGLDAALSQPYDSLDAIPEEVEYANTQDYEQLGLVS